MPCALGQKIGDCAPKDQPSHQKRGECQGQIEDFGQGSPAEFWTQREALSPKFARNRGFSNCMILKTSRPGPQAPGSASGECILFIRFDTEVLLSTSPSTMHTCVSIAGCCGWQQEACCRGGRKSTSLLTTNAKETFTFTTQARSHWKPRTGFSLLFSLWFLPRSSFLLWKSPHRSSCRLFFRDPVFFKISFPTRQTECSANYFTSER